MYIHIFCFEYKHGLLYIFMRLLGFLTYQHLYNSSNVEIVDIPNYFIFIFLGIELLFCLYYDVAV